MEAMAGFKRRLQRVEVLPPPVLSSPSMININMVADELAPVKAFVAAALAMRLKGIRTNYSHMVNTIRNRDDMETLPRLFVALTSCTTTITSEPDKFKDLLAAIFKYDWSGGNLVTGAYRDLLAHLVSANSTFLHPTLQMLARSFAIAVYIKGRGAAPAAAVPSNTTIYDEGENEELASKYKVIHETLRIVLKLVPSGLSELFPALRDAFPHRRIEGPGSIVNYTKQLLVIADIFPGLKDKLLSLIIERSLEIDVEIKIEDTGEARVSVEDHEGALVLSEHIYHDPELEAQPQEQPEQPEVDEMAEKLDGVMLLLFEYMDRKITSNDNQAPGLFEGLVPTLETSILSTHRCKYVQFTLFYLASRDHTGRVPCLLMHRLIDLAIDDAAPVVARQAALAFLSSYLVRSRALSVESVVEALTSLVNVSEAHAARYAPDIMALGLEKGFWGDSQDEDILEQDDDEGEVEDDDEVQQGPAGMVPPGAAGGGRDDDGQCHHRHTIFYSICQAIFYVVAFHHSTLGGLDVLGGVARSSPSGSPTMGGQSLKARLGRLACSPLRPLDQCLESVKREFLRLARLHSLVPPGALVGLGYRCREGSEGGLVDQQQGGGRSLMHAQGGGGGAGGQSNYLDSYFPFDPYILRRSSRYVASPECYRYWQSVAEVEGEEARGKEEEDDDWSAWSVTSEDPNGVDEEEDEEEDDEEEEEEEEGGEAIVAMSVGSGVGTMYMKQALVGSKGEKGVSVLVSKEQRSTFSSVSVKKAGRGGRERIASMDCADDEYTDRYGEMLPSLGDHTSGDEEYDDDEGGGGITHDDDEECVEGHGGEIGRVLAMERIRKESIGSVGSW